MAANEELSFAVIEREWWLWARRSFPACRVKDLHCSANAVGFPYAGTVWRVELTPRGSGKASVRTYVSEDGRRIGAQPALYNRVMRRRGETGESA